MLQLFLQADEQNQMLSIRLTIVGSVVFLPVGNCYECNVKG